MLSELGLLVFIVIVLVDIAVLLFDLYLAETGRRTITNRVRTERPLGLWLGGASAKRG